MTGRLSTAGFLVGLFLIMLAAKLTGFVSEGIFVYVLAACFLMAAVELLCAGSFREAQSEVFPSFRRNFFVPAVEIGLLLAAVVALLGGPLDGYFYPLITFPMSDAEVMFLLVLSAVTDAVMFSVGGIFTRLGISHRVKFLANISPKKTYEGYIGGMVCAFALLGIFYFILPSWLPDLFDGVTNSEYVKVFAVAACPVIFIGDLLGSASKRVLQIKDSDQFAQKIFFVRWLEKPMAGHGGYLDRFDSTCLCVCTYMLIKVFVAPSLWL